MKTPHPQKKKSRAWKWILLALASLVGLLSVLGGVIFIAYQGGEEFYRKACYLSPTGAESFTIPTASVNKTTFVAIGDTAVYRDGLLKNKARVARAAIKTCEEKNCDFMLFLGDNISDAGIGSPYDEELGKLHADHYAAFKKPIVAVIGNHDYRTNVYAMIAYTYVDRSWTMPSGEFNFIAGPASFNVLNSNCDIIPYWRLMKRPMAKPEQWSFLVAHHPIYSSGQHKSSPFHIRALWNLAHSDRFDFSLAGHNHLLEHWVDQGQRTHHIVSGGGSDSYDAKSVGRSLGKIPSEVAYRNLDSGFVLFQVDSKESQVSFLDGDGKQLYQFTQQHPHLKAGQSSLR